MKKDVSVWQEEVIIPTYPVGKAEKNPMFLENRVYQGSSGVVYPHPVIENIADEKIDQVYQAVYLENEYIKVMVLPELGGRIQMAYDKVRERHFIYYNQVIKPALVGLTGPWISGGIEFNWPQHHRPSTFQPVDFTIKENADGSKTVWLNEVERMFRTKGLAGITLHPGKAYIEISGRLYNRTPFPQTFLWWANPAVKVNDHYQSVFPPDVYAVFDHGKRDVSSFPIAKGVYYKVDYSPGTDISRYKNIPVPTSYMAITSKYNFIGGYEHDSRAGLLHVADHHISPGKKQWTWGNGAFGQAWDKNLTDEDGPYIELMTGVFTDNQPDFSWLQPYEQKEFTQYFMPYSEVGVVSNASKEIVVGLQPDQQMMQLKVYATSVFESAEIKVNTVNGNEIYSSKQDLSPVKAFVSFFEMPGNTTLKDLVVSIYHKGRKLIDVKYEEAGEQEIPVAAQAAKRPAEVENNEQLFLTGQHLEQYRHATYKASDYYQEALRRDPKDIRCNNAMGLLKLRQGHFEEAEGYFRKAIATSTQRNPNPYDGEPYYNLGWSLQMQGKYEQAFDAFYKSTWNHAWQHAGFLNLARIACRRKDFEEALKFAEQSIVGNYHSHTARHLKVLALRKLGRMNEAVALIEESLHLDPFNFGCIFEKMQMVSTTSALESVTNELLALSRNWVHNMLEYALDYAHAGMKDEAIRLLELHVRSSDEKYPMIFYSLGWLYQQKGDDVKAAEFYSLASQLKPDHCFPNRIEEVLILQAAMAFNKKDAKAPYYLGNFWYDKRQYDDAIRCWEESVAIDNSFPTAHRNLSLAYYNKQHDENRSHTSLTKAFELDTTDARVLMELDQLRKRLNHDHAARLMFLEKYSSLVESRDDLFLELITLHNQLGHFETAKELLAGRKFHPWEGGEGKVVNQYLICYLELARKSIQSGDYSAAIELLDQAAEYPDNLGEGKLPGAAENDIHFLKGIALQRIGDVAAAQQMFQNATEGNSEPAQAIFYNDPQPDKILYQGLAWIELGEKKKAEQIFRKLIAFGETHIEDHITIDYFAVSLPELLVFDIDLDLRNRIHCNYLIALGELGLAINAQGETGNKFDKILSLDRNHQGALLHKNLKAQLDGSVKHLPEK
jgi:tetratricopeptide (TPR) repeat protein